jgi:tRNA pseudouridine55 synthase
VNVSEGQARAALAGFTGQISQIPPMYSAVSIGGKRLYQLAREGITVERPAREVTIRALSLDQFAEDRLTVTVICSKGTYIRVLAEDIGRALGCGASLEGLRRSATAGLRIADAHDQSAIESLPLPMRDGLLLPADTLVSQFPPIVLGSEETKLLMQGRTVAAQAVSGTHRAYGPHGEFLGLVTAEAGQLTALRLMSEASVLRGNSPRELIQ